MITNTKVYPVQHIGYNIFQGTYHPRLMSHTLISTVHLPRQDNLDNRLNSNLVHTVPHLVCSQNHSHESIVRSHQLDTPTHYLYGSSHQNYSRSKGHISYTPPSCSGRQKMTYHRTSQNIHLTVFHHLWT
ncbi:hypothetical protein HanXRQr2_Chr12g0533301 [Helianthus annuus]|uniref:Uncharacterized protein n=1 Tax=Helianthus annuus TaxID=4232 RepID=A0A9K3HFA9_HELAN|nr:hypothetical protein HanXRQr2_Chr12g0533301 [Helianthus annuus]KAJ0862048.1 hypothetical protein HanPSC8_Chr12g0513611 [Helianthus annuus]